MESFMFNIVLVLSFCFVMVIVAGVIGVVKFVEKREEQKIISEEKELED